MWNFSPNAPSTRKVDNNPYGEKMIKDFADRPSIFGENITTFTPVISTETCDCEVSFPYSLNTLKL